MTEQDCAIVRLRARELWCLDAYCIQTGLIVVTTELPSIITMPTSVRQLEYLTREQIDQVSTRAYYCLTV